MNPIKFNPTALKHAQSQQSHFNDITDDRIKQTTHVVITEVLPIFTMYFADFSAKYGKAKKETTDAVMREYALQLIKNGVTRSRLLVGLERLRKESVTLKWTPNPQAFAELCMPQPEDMGLPELDVAIKEITEARGMFRGQPYNFSHHIIETLNKNAGFQMYEMSKSEWHKLLSNSYGQLVKQAMRGELKEPVAALPHRPDPKRAEIENAIYQRGEKLLSENTNNPLMKRINALKNVFKGEK